MKRIRVKLKEIKHLLNLNVDAVKHGLSEGYFQLCFIFMMGLLFCLMANGFSKCLTLQHSPIMRIWIQKNHNLKSQPNATAPM